MKIKSNVATNGERKYVEIPKSVRHNFQKGEEVYIENIKSK
jgi:hypothetical protein